MMMNSNSGGGINVPADYDQVTTFLYLHFYRIISSSINKNCSLRSGLQNNKQLLKAHVRPISAKFCLVDAKIEEEEQPYKV